MSSYKLSLEDRTFLSHYTSLRDEEADTFAAANAERLRATFDRVNALGASSSEWLRPQKVTAITVLRCAPRGMSPAPPLSKKDRALLDTYAGLSGAEAIAFYEKHRDALITASLAAAHAADDGSNNTPPAAFPPLPPPLPAASTSPALAPVVGTLQVRLSVVRESSGDALAVDLDYGTGSPIRVMTLDPAIISRGWQQSFVINLCQQPMEITQKPNGSLTIKQKNTPATPAASTSLPSKLRRIFKSKP